MTDSADIETGCKAFIKSWNPIEVVVFFLTVCTAAVGFFLYPTYSNYDSIYSLIWGWELIHGHSLSFDAFRAPTQHPLSVLYCAVLAFFFDNDANRAVVASTLFSYVVLAAGVYRLGKVKFSWVVGAIAALLLLTRRDYVFLAVRSFVDIPYLALIIWALAFESEKPRRGGVVWVLLVASGLLRPEAWLIVGMYWVWVNISFDIDQLKEKAWRNVVGRRHTWKNFFLSAFYVVLAPAIWIFTDFIVTGDPFFSSSHTNSLAAVLDKQSKPAELPELVVRYMLDLTKFPVVVAALFGGVFALRYKLREAIWPVTLVVIGLGIFILAGLGGTAVIGQPRYLAMAPIGCFVLAGFVLYGWYELPKKHALKLPWALLAIFLAGFIVSNSLTSGWRSLAADLRDRHKIQTELRAVLHNRQVAAGRRCGTTTVPTHKLIPDVRWWLKADKDAVLARAGLPNGGRDVTGAALFVTGRRMLRHTAYGPFDPFVPRLDNPLILVPGQNYHLVKRTPRFAAYVACQKH